MELEKTDRNRIKIDFDLSDVLEVTSYRLGLSLIQADGSKAVLKTNLDPIDIYEASYSEYFDAVDEVTIEINLELSHRVDGYFIDFKLSDAQAKIPRDFVSIKDYKATSDFTYRVNSRDFSVHKSILAGKLYEYLLRYCHTLRSSYIVMFLPLGNHPYYCHSELDLENKQSQLISLRLSLSYYRL
jgi:hypothetical protein